MNRKASRSRMDANRHIQSSRFLVKWEEMSVAQVFVAFETTHENAAGAVLFGEARFLQGLVHREQRQHRYPTQPLRGILPNIREPAIIAASDGQFQVRPLGIGTQKNRRVEHLDIYAQLVHMLETSLEIVHFSGFFGGSVAAISSLSHITAVHELLLAGVVISSGRVVQCR